MARTATICSARLSLSDMDRDHYQDYNLRIARHPSETDERMMIRLLAFLLHADEHLEFGAGLSTDDEPALWQKSLDGRIVHWIDVGLPDPKRLRQAHGRAEHVSVLAYGGGRVATWLHTNTSALEALDHLTVRELPAEQCAALTGLAGRTMALTASIQDGTCWISDEAGSTVEIHPQTRLPR